MHISYDYLLGMPIYQLTHEKIEELKKQEKEKNAEYKSLNELTAEDIWKHELIELKSSLESVISKVEIIDLCFWR